jgi:hypothetical protein
LIDILEVQDKLGENGNGDYSIKSETFGEKLRYLWFTEEIKGIVPDEGTLIEIKLKAKKDLKSLENVLFQKNNPESNLIFFNQEINQFKLEIFNKFNEGNFEVKAVNTNEISEKNLQLFVSTSTNENASVLIFDQTGRQVASKKIEFIAGKQIYDIFENINSVGVLTVLVKYSSGQKTLRLVKI